MIKITRIYRGFGKGNPGYNVKIIVEKDGEVIGYNSYPNVDGPVTRGIFKELHNSSWVDAIEEMLYQRTGKKHWASEISIEMSNEEFEKFTEKFRTRTKD